MSYKIALNNLIIQVDPCDHWSTEKATTTEVVLARMGLVPMFVGLAFAEHKDNVAEAVVQMYQMGGWSQDPSGNFTPEGVKQYPGDPDQYPFVAIRPMDPEQEMASNVKVIYMYEHDWVAFQFKDDTFKHLRMD